MNPAANDHREAKLAYKQGHQPIGVYQIRNLATGRIYFGSSNNLDAIFNRHRFDLSLNSHRIKELQQDWKDYGEANFVFEVLEMIEQSDEPGHNYREELKELEQTWLERLNPEYRL